MARSNLFDNIRKRRKAGKRMRKPGQKGEPTQKQFTKAVREAKRNAKRKRG